jgi:hypothetical protein
VKLSNTVRPFMYIKRSTLRTKKIAVNGMVKAQFQAMVPVPRGPVRNGLHTRKALHTTMSTKSKLRKDYREKKSCWVNNAPQAFKTLIAFCLPRYLHNISEPNQAQALMHSICNSGVAAHGQLVQRQWQPNMISIQITHVCALPCGKVSAYMVHRPLQERTAKFRAQA